MKLETVRWRKRRSLSHCSRTVYLYCIGFMCQAPAARWYMRTTGYRPYVHPPASSLFLGGHSERFSQSRLVALTRIRIFCGNKTRITLKMYTFVSDTNKIKFNTLRWILENYIEIGILIARFNSCWTYKRFTSQRNSTVVLYIWLKLGHT